MRAVVLALTVALVASHQINLVPEFAAGKTYVYKYEGLLLGGLPQEGLAKAGVKVSSKVLISAVAQNSLLLKLQDPQLFEYTGIWPQDSFVPAAKLTSALNAQLVMPIKFEYSNGVVGKIFAPAGVSATVLNLHRGILNILQLNLKNTQNVYELHEAGPQGICKTHYMITEDVQTHQIAVRKSKDLNNCHDRVRKDIGLAYTETCEECQQRLKSLTGTATFSYIMKPTDTGALVSEATVEEVHQFSLLNTATGAAQMKAKQMLNLQEVQNSPIAPPAGEYSVRGSLQYEFATEIYQTPIQLLKINNAQAQIAEVLQHLVANNAAMVHEDAPLKFVQLVQLMRVATLENIEAIWAQYKNKPVHRQWILDAVPVVGTQVALRFIKEKFQADELAVSEVTQALLVALHMATANQDTIHLTANLATNPKVKNIPVLREVIMLGHGSLIAKYCAEVPTCHADLLKPIHDSAAEAISKAEIPEITLALKVLGNAGHPASLKTIMKLLPGFGSAAASIPMRVQTDAILALRNIAKREPKLVQPVALQLFMDRALHPELRMVACIVLFETKPSVALMATLGGALEKETNKHVVSFAYSYMKSLTRSMTPDNMNLAAAANVAVRMLSHKLDRLSEHFSRANHFDLYISPFMVGAAGSAYLINDAATILPRAVIAKARAYLAGAAADVIEVGIRTEGLQEALQKTPAADENADRITKIINTFKALMDWKSLPSKQQLASVYVKVLGQEIAFANIDKNFIHKIIIEQAAQFTTGLRARELMKEAFKALQKGVAIQYAKPLLAAEVRRILPTSLGVPMELSYYTAAVAVASLNVQGSITPPLPEHPQALTLDQLMKSNLQLQAEARPSVALQTFAVIGVNTAFIQAAVMARGKVHTVLPAKLVLKADLPKGNVKLEVLPAAAVPDHIASVSFETVAVARNIEDLPDERVVSLAPPVSSDAAQRLIPSSVQKTLCAVCPYLLIKVCLEVSSKNAGFMESNPLYYFIGRHSVRVSLTRGDGPALEKLEFEVQAGSKAAEKLTKEISLINAENPEESTILLKLREILESGPRNKNSSSSSSSSSVKNSKSASSSKSGSSSSRNVNSSSRSSSSSSRSGHNSRNNSTSSSSSSKSGSSSRSSSSNANSYGQFWKFHNDQGRSKASSASSIEAVQRQVRLLGDAVPPAFAIIARAVRADRKLGYQLAAYLDKSTSRVQVVFATLAANDKWKICADAILPSKHKVAARFAIGEQCQDYSVTVKAETGMHDAHPAACLEMGWNRVPKILNNPVHYAQRAMEDISVIAPLVGFNADRANNNERQINLILALPTEKSLNILLRTPKMTMSKQAVPLSMALPVEQDGTIPALKNLDIQAIVEKWLRDIQQN
ncbi:vitellogenin-like isoform X1 [Silurus meridionalis]|uniref:vitellogenin-like isoform X1 n=1 Tax=Silurus meridionalis TaxID=175797 RepID=UPI001EECDF27|nr:vitellogenin-like isoform X1 [Silurus meridionalis]